MTGPVEGSVWYYAPNKPAPIVFTVIFAIGFAWHTYQTIRYKTWRMTGLLPWASIVYCAGFAMRAAGAWNYDNLGILIGAQVLLYCAQPIYAGANYFILSRVLYYIPYLSPMHPGRVVSTFIGLDIIIEIITAQGISRLANSSQSDTSLKVGGALLKAGLLMQLSLFIGFLAIAIIFHCRAQKTRVLSHNVSVVLWMLYLSTTLLCFRAVFRTTENFEASYERGKAPQGKLFADETYFWCLEVIPVTLAAFLLNVLHPGAYLPKSNKIYLSKDGVTEVEGPGWEDKRPFLATVFDPFDLCGIMFGKKSQHSNFWDNETAPTALTQPTYTAP